MKKAIIPLTALMSGLLQAETSPYHPKLIPAGYSVETISTPLDPTGAPLAFGVGGIDFAENGDVFIASRLHGIWKYRNDSWLRFSDHLHDPQGIHVVDNNSVVVAQKPELTLINLLIRTGHFKAHILKHTAKGCHPGAANGNQVYPLDFVRDSVFVQIHFCGFPFQKRHRKSTKIEDTWIEIIQNYGIFVQFHVCRIPYVEPTSQKNASRVFKYSDALGISRSLKTRISFSSKSAAVTPLPGFFIPVKRPS